MSSITILPRGAAVIKGEMRRSAVFGPTGPPHHWLKCLTFAPGSACPEGRRAQWGSNPGAADKAASLGGESPLPSIAWFGRLAYPMHVPVTVRVLLGRRSHGCPAA